MKKQCQKLVNVGSFTISNNEKLLIIQNYIMNWKERKGPCGVLLKT